MFWIVFWTSLKKITVIWFFLKVFNAIMTSNVLTFFAL